MVTLSSARKKNVHLGLHNACRTVQYLLVQWCMEIINTTATKDEYQQQ